MYRLRARIVGKPHDFRPIHYDTRQQLVETVRMNLPPEVTQVLFVRIDGTTTKIATEQDSIVPTAAKWFKETKDPVDGAIVFGPRTGIFVANADCPFLVVHTGGSLLALHCAFRCLVNEQGESIVLRALSEHVPDPSKIERMFFGFGAGPCCFGQDAALSNPEIRSNVPASVIERATRGPRAGSLSVNLHRLAMLHLRQAYQREWDQVRLSPQIYDICTACAGRMSGGPGTYWSHIWDGKPVPGQCEKTAGRNGVFFWLE